ncbi:hypothetical protein BJY04DRAFT_200333 [Aspergillus karnatakaensis]|uniref:uncharacterized protein n=1 Tax=Aspergillus karnatakaensis TaxID=1810916 RepID=UPI003CCD7B9B
MSAELDSLPAELILEIRYYLHIKEQNALVQTARTFHLLLSPALYARGATHVGQKTTPLIWAVQ